ncbi:UDP-N-acetylglucosamine 2-epimerase [Nocardioides convexus]|uniref:UDP-N-acetylglucosamine 2-epimerase n=1 Tax=Nocardioides convexus TaxID=2712224 RepID=UPI002418AF72|nr:UDP-N-acetylglucosamine 2-epimerase [Nocardioides convexus]
MAIVYGTRPEAVKVAPLWRALQAHPRLRPVLISTGQHRDLLREPARVVRHGARRGPRRDDRGTGPARPHQPGAHRADRPAWRSLRPAAVVVHGDTTTSMAGALAARYAGVPVVHLEAGLRTHDLLSPFPEEPQPPAHRGDGRPAPRAHRALADQPARRGGPRRGDRRHRQHRHRRPARDQRAGAPDRGPHRAGHDRLRRTAGGGHPAPPRVARRPAAPGRGGAGGA